MLGPHSVRSCWITCSRMAGWREILSQGLPLPAQPLGQAGPGVDREESCQATNGADD